MLLSIILTFLAVIGGLICFAGFIHFVFKED